MGGGAYNNFHTNVCRFFGTLKRGIGHKAPVVSLPLSNVGLELAQMLRNVGVLAGFEVVQKHPRRVRFGRRWPAGAEPATSAEVAGCPNMSLRLHLSYERPRMLFSLPSSVAPFVTPMTVARPTPDSVTLVSRPTFQQFMTLAQLLSKRRHMPPGIMLVSTDQGIMTDIEAELHGIGGILLAHLGLPLGQVVQLRGILRDKYLEEERAASEAAVAGLPRPQRTKLGSWPLAARLTDTVLPRILGEEQTRQAVDLSQAVLEADSEDLRALDRIAGIASAAGGGAPPHETLAGLRLAATIWPHREEFEGPTQERSGEQRSGGEGGGGGAGADHQQRQQLRRGARQRDDGHEGERSAPLGRRRHDTHRSTVQD